MEQLLGFFAFLVTLALTILVCVKFPRAKKIILVAYFLRALTVILGYYVVALPDSQADAASFENYAHIWASSGLSAVFDHFEGPDSYFISFVYGVLYNGPQKKNQNKKYFYS